MTTLTLAAIVRNEADLLPRMLDSVKRFVDEIVIVDTGSTDDTVAVARRYTDKVITTRFEDDFAAVRNLSLASATKDWILVLDADEWLEPGAGEAIVAAIENRRVCGYYLKFLNHLGGDRIHQCGILRLFRRDPSIRFEFCIHEQVIPSLIGYAKRRGMKLGPLDSAVVHHDGYLKQRVLDRDKDARNMRLFQRQIELHPNHAYSWYKYGDFLRRFDDKRDEAERALNTARKLVESMPHSDSKDLSFCPEIYALLALEAEHRGDVEGALAIVTDGRKRFGETPNLLFVLGHLQAKTGDHRASFRTYARLRLADRQLHAIPPEPGVTGPYAYFGMGRALANLSHRRAAMRCLDRSIALDAGKLDPYLLRARLRLEGNDLVGAASDYANALAAHPKDFGTRLRLAQLLLHCGDCAGAAEQLERALVDGAEASLVMPRLGQARLGCGEFERALDAFASLPADPDCRMGIELLTLLSEGKDPRSTPRFSTPALRPWRKLVDRALQTVGR